MKKIVNQRLRGKLVRILTAVLMWSALAPIGQSFAGQPQRVLMCTSAGYQWVEVEDAAEFPLTPNANHCVFCLSDEDLDCAISSNISSIIPALGQLIIEREPSSPTFSSRFAWYQARPPPVTS